jgi:hypothetical protein
MTLTNKIICHMYFYFRIPKMPVCTVCESEDFDERDGLYYCQICMTQSQVGAVLIKHSFPLHKGDMKICSPSK